MVKATGLVRRVDALGEIVLPQQLRVELGIDRSTSLELHQEGNLVVLEAHAE